jgi:hypothetical protein
MKIGVFATFMSPNTTPSMIKAFGQRAEGLGLESIWMGEHGGGGVMRHVTPAPSARGDAGTSPWPTRPRGGRL